MFLGKCKFTEEEMREIEDRIGFEEMKKDKFSNLGDVKELNQFFRKGEIGSRKAQFTVRLPFGRARCWIGCARSGCLELV